MVVDTNEAWIFHILGVPDGSTAIWVAQKVKDDEFSVVANMFVIREVNLTDDHNFMYSSSMIKNAKDNNLWKEGTPFDFTKI